MREIEIDKSRKPGGWKFEVTVKDDQGQSQHRVRMDDNYFEKVAKGRCKPEEFIEASFYFLLEREPKESILSSFDVTQISNYFPEFENAIQGRL